MTLYFNNKKSKYLYYNGKKVKEAYCNGHKVYSEKHIWYGSEGGTVSGGDYWNTRVNTFRASNSGTITYTNTMPSGTWNYQYKCQKQSTVTTHNVTMTITYTDNTTLTVFSKSDYPANNGSEPNVYTGSFNATKPWKKMTISSNSQASNTSWCYLMVGPVVYIEYVG